MILLLRHVGTVADACVRLAGRARRDPRASSAARFVRISSNGRRESCSNVPEMTLVSS